MRFMWNWKLPKLDVLLWLCRDVHVLLRPLADLRVRDPPLWPVSRTFNTVQFVSINTDAVVLCVTAEPLCSPSNEG